MRFIGWFALMIVVIGLLMIAWVGVDQARGTVYNWTSTGVTNADSKATIETLNTMWLWFPLLMLFTFIMYMVQRQGSEGAYE